MKKVMMMLAVVACAASAFADISMVAIKIYRPSVHNGTGWVAASGTCLSDLDRDLTTETHRTAPHNSSDTTWQGSQEPYSTVDTPASDYTYAIKKTGGTEGVLASGYSCYLIQGTTYTALAQELGADELCYNDFVSKYSAYKTSDDGLYYGFNGAKHLQNNIYTYADGTSVAGLDPTKLVAVMTYLDSDASAAQYALVQYDAKVSTGDIAWFQSALENGSGVSTLTSWQDFASVPEPTSGLLLLLGVAGLALKRKRA